MIFFSSLSPVLQNTVSVLFFVSLLNLTVAAISGFVNRGFNKRQIIDGALFAAGMILLSFMRSKDIGKTSAKNDIPLSVILLVCAGIYIYSICLIINEYKKEKNTLTSSSIKQALDDLNSGICFADKNGRIILINNAMGSLISSLIGSFPQTLEEITNALCEFEYSGDTNEVKGVYKLPDGSIWKLSLNSLQDGELEGFTQAYAQNVSDLYEVNSKLKSENEELRITNEKTAQMLERLADRIREQETLKLKMQIHGDIGASLIKISKLMNANESESIAQQLSLLENAVSFFSNNKALSQGNIEAVFNKAEGLGVELIINGSYPKEEEATELLVLAMNECLTNCVIHAGGSKVFVDIKESSNEHLVSITNNGKPPKSEIHEGGGLSALRRRIEGAGHRMAVLSDGQFALIIKLKKGETN